MDDYEKLGVFYLGRGYNPDTNQTEVTPVLYDSKDLVTHAVVLGMTGSGKTGLCVNIIEEAAIDGVPAILIDPKGDLTNLLLTFPNLRGEDFLPWINVDDANRKGLSPEDYASQQAEIWKKGLADWSQSGERIQRLRDAAEFVIYTPGSTAGIPVSIVKSFAVPPTEVLEDSELLQERINTTVTSLLGLIGIDADPLQSREYILLSTIMGAAWRQGVDLDLPRIIQQVQKPPVSQIGVLDLESFYPERERFALVMALNNLIASPGFSTWLQGVPLDIGEILHTNEGKPRVAIFSIAHLSDAERMFFVSLLLNQVLGWMRTQPGTGSLRALVYMDEIFGYFPPVANPPSKAPLLTLLKQARAYGVGIVLATQNPVDLDYKGLSNTGTWFIGRLQTERDKMRVMDGLEGAAAATGSSLDRNRMDQLISGLGSRVFLMNNTHDDSPSLLQTRWCLSYLRGPLTRQQIKVLMGPYVAQQSALGAAAPMAVAAPSPAAAPAAPASPTLAQVSQSGSAGHQGGQPVLPPEIRQYFVASASQTPAQTSLVYKPMLLGAASVRFDDVKSRTDVSRPATYLAAITDEARPVSWETSSPSVLRPEDLQSSPAPNSQFEPVPGEAGRAKNYPIWSRDFADWLTRNEQLVLWLSPSTKEVSKPGESERDFRVRLQQSFRENRDEMVDALRKKYAPKIEAMEEKVRRAEDTVERESDQARAADMNTAVSVGTSILGAFLGGGRRRSLGSAGRGASRSMSQREDVKRAEENLEVYRQKLQELQDEFSTDIADLQSRMDPQLEELEVVTLRPKKSDIDVRLVSLVWVPTSQEAPASTEAPANRNPWW